jgi:hypothetical protein
MIEEPMSMDWLKTQVETIRERESIIIWETCQVKGGGIRSMTLIIIYLL